MTNRSIFLLLVEDHEMVRSGMVSMLRRVGFTNIEEVGAVAEARAVVESGRQIDLALLDLNLPDSSGTATIDALQKIDPFLPIILITGDIETSTMRYAFERGVLGFVPKTANQKVVLAAIELVLAGGKYIPQEMLAILCGASIESLSDVISKQGDFDSGADNLMTRLTGLTLRQKEICEHLLMGLSNKDIARIMGISPGTVKVHVSAILRVLNVETRAKALWLLTRKSR